MQLRIWAKGVVIVSCLLTSPVLANQVVNKISPQADNLVISSQTRNTKLISVSKAEFGVFRINSKGQVTFIPTTKVPLLEGTAYGWRIRLSDYQGKVTWREVLRLPKQPESWGTEDGENFSISPDGTQAAISRTALTKKGTFTNSWKIAPGDPSGKHTIEVYIDNRRIASFDFEVVSLKKLINRR